VELSFFPLTLEALDAAAGESLCLFVAADERPLQGLAGLADWRLSGRLSRLLRGGLLTGASGEAVLTQPGIRLGFKKLFLFGVGPAGRAEEEVVGQITAALRKLADAGVREAALQFPTRLSPEAGVRALVSEPQAPARAAVFGPEPQKYITALGQVARRASVPPPPGPVDAPKPPAHVAAPVAVPQPQVPAVKPALQPRPPPEPAIPKASPLPFAPQGDPPPPILTPPPPPAIPMASPPSFLLPPAPPAPASSPPAIAAPDDRRPTPPPPQRYVPSPPKQNVFDKSKRRKK